MQKTLEILKSEDGLTIKRLSHKKLLFVYKVPILLGDSSDVVVGYVPLKIRYRINEDIKETLSDTDYKVCNLNKLYRGISQKWSVKLNQIATQSERRVIKVQENELSFNLIIKSFHFLDPAWIRDYRLNNLLK